MTGLRAVAATFLLAGSAFAQAPTGITYGWEATGLSGGGATYRPSISPHDPNLILLSCDMRNTFRTQDGGKTWDMLDMNVISTCTESQACWHPKDPNLVWWGSAMGLMESADKGKTWKKVAGVPAWGTVSRMLISRANPDVRLAGATRGTWRTADGGKTWEPCATLAGQILSFAEFGGSLFAATSEGVFRSDDGGKTWAVKNKGLSGAKTKDFCGGEKAGRAVVYCLEDKPSLKVFRSLDKGESWEPAMGELPPAEYHRIVCAETEPDVVYMNRMGEGAGRYDIYKTADAGKTWTNCYTLGEKGNVEYGWMDYAPAFGKGWTGRFKRGFSISPTNPDVVVGCNSAEVYVTQDGGKTWCERYCTPVGKPSKTSAWSSNGFVVTSTWLYAVDPADRNRHYICCTDIGFARSEDGGKSWINSVNGSPWRNTFYYLVFDPGHPGTLYASASEHHDLPFAMRQSIEGEGGVAVSRDYGRTWSRSGTGLPANRPATSIARDGKGLFVAMINDGVYRSDDGGETWVKKSNGLGKSGNANVYLLKADRKGSLYCTITQKKNADGIGVSEKETGGLFKSEDRGESWTCLKDLHAAMNFDIDPTDENVIYLAAYDWTVTRGKVDHEGGIYRTVDGGKTWEKVKPVTKAFSDWTIFGCYDVAVHPEKPNVVFASWKANEPSGGIAWSTDKGKTWKEFDKAPFISPDRITLDGDTIYVTTFGSGVWKKHMADLK